MRDTGQWHVIDGGEYVLDEDESTATVTVDGVSHTVPADLARRLVASGDDAGKQVGAVRVQTLGRTVDVRQAASIIGVDIGGVRDMIADGTLDTQTYTTPLGKECTVVLTSSAIEAHREHMRNMEAALRWLHNLQEREDEE